MGKKSDISDDDKKAFRDAVSDVKPLKKSNKQSSPKSKQPSSNSKASSPNKNFETSVASQDTSIIDDAILDEVGAEAALEFHRPGLQNKQLKALRRGELAIEARLDLHGLTRHEAKIELLAFIERSQEQSIRHVLIIHGKGKRSGADIPIIKNLVNSWLKQLPSVLAFCSAVPRDGGTGAVYVYLRKV